MACLPQCDVSHGRYLTSSSFSKTGCKWPSQRPPSLMHSVASIRSEFSTPYTRGFTYNLFNSLFSYKRKQKKETNSKVSKAQRTKLCLKWEVSHEALFPCELWHPETMCCYLGFQMAKLRSQIIKQKVHVLNSDHLTHVREGVWRSVFSNEGGKKQTKQNWCIPAGHGKALLWLSCSISPRLPTGLWL